MKPSAQTLQQIYNAIYPPDGSMPMNAEARHWRDNEDARAQLFMSLLVQQAICIEKLEQCVLMLTGAIKKVGEGASTGDVDESEAPPVPGGAMPAQIDEVAGDAPPLPTVQATTSAFVPAARPMPGPMNAAIVPQGGGEVTVAPFQPANVSAPAPAAAPAVPAAQS